MNCAGLERTVLLVDPARRLDRSAARRHLERCARCRAAWPEVLALVRHSSPAAVRRRAALLRALAAAAVVAAACGAAFWPGSDAVPCHPVRSAYLAAAKLPHGRETAAAAAPPIAEPVLRPIPLATTQVAHTRLRYLPDCVRTDSVTVTSWFESPRSAP